MKSNLKSKIHRHQIFYLPPEALRGGTAVFPEDESRHMAKSLRLQAGDRVKATDGAGKLFDAEITGSAGSRLEARILRTAEERPPEPRLTIFQGVVRPQRMDMLVEKAAELTAACLVPVECARCVRRVARPRLARWRRIAREALKQSLGTYLLEVAEPVSFADAAGGLGAYDLVLLASGEPGAEALREAVRSRPATAAIWVGPEGGFTPEEAGALIAAGAVPFSLGARRLRSETAAIAAIAVLRQME